MMLCVLIGCFAAVVGAAKRHAVDEMKALDVDSEKMKQVIGNATKDRKSLGTRGHNATKSKRIRIAESDRSVVFWEWVPPHFRVRVGPVRDVLPGNGGQSLMEMDADGAVPTLMATLQKDAIEEQTEYNNCRGGGKRIALTFDDGPSGINTQQVLDVLEEKGAVATFFEVGGSWATDCRQHQNYAWCGDLWTRMLKTGSTVGYHNYRHHAIADTTRSLSYVKNGTKHAQLAFARVLGHHPLLFRPPDGLTGVGSEGYELFKSLGYKFINWNLHTWDWTYVGDKDAPPNGEKTHRIVDVFTKALQSGNPYISLMHDTDSFQWIDFFPEMLDTIKKASYNFVTMEDCLGITDRDQVYAPEGLGFKKPNAGTTQDGSSGSCETGWQLYRGPKVRPDMFAPICIAEGICKSWGYEERDGVCSFVDSAPGEIWYKRA